MANVINATSTGNGGLVSTGDDSGILNIQTNETTAITVDTSQNVGIGTSSPAYRLDAISTGGTQTARFRSGDTATTVDIASFERSDSAVRAVINYNSSDGAMTYGTSTNHPIAFKTNNTERMRIETNGNFFYGYTSGDYANSNSFKISTTLNNSGYIIVNHLNGSASGNVYAGFGYNGSAIGSITQNGTTGVLYNLTSDYRLKNNPIALTDAKDFVMALQPKKWQWWDGSGEGVGFVAHEFMEVAKYSGNGTKDAVDDDGKPIYQSIQPSSSEVMANMVALMQEQQATITAQAETLTQQTEAINALTARIVALEQKGTV